MATERLYYQDSMLKSCRARVTDCRREGEAFLVELDRTVFFPQGGGQAGDQGHIGPARVEDTQEKEGRIWHYCDRALEPGQELDCAIDWQTRFQRMQAHTGEHIVSGLAHSLYGCNNVGFHMGKDFVTIDFDRELSREELAELELRACQGVWEDLEVRAFFPTARELEGLDYRSKLELTEDLRLVEIPGIDLCACCAPHLHRTGQVGIIKILSAERHRGGVRLELVFGAQALEEFRLLHHSGSAISQALSVRRHDISAGVERLLQERQQLKERGDYLSLELARRMAESQSAVEGNIAVFEDALDPVASRELVNLLMEKTQGIAAALAREGEGYRYIMGSLHVDLRAKAKEINALISGRGGGRPQMIQGSAQADKDTILAALSRSFK